MIISRDHRLLHPSYSLKAPLFDVLFHVRVNNGSNDHVTNKYRIEDTILSNFSPWLFQIPMKGDMIGYQSRDLSRVHVAVPGMPWHPDSIGKIVTWQLTLEQHV